MFKKKLNTLLTTTDYGYIKIPKLLYFMIIRENLIANLLLYISILR